MHQFFDLVGIADHLYREFRMGGKLFCLCPELIVLSGEEYRLNIELASDKFLENGGDVATADPAGVDENGEFLRIEPESPPGGLGVCLADLFELGMQGQARDLDLFVGNAVVDQLAASIFIRD